MVQRVDGREVLEDVVVGREGGRGEHRAEDRVGRVVEGVGGDHGAAVDVAREHELDLGDPLLDGLSLGLRALVVLLEVVREVAVQVETAGIVPGKRSRDTGS